MAEDRAHWCVVTRQPWDLWLSLTEVERTAFFDMAQKFGGF